MRAQPLRRSSIATGSPKSSSVTRSASSRGSDRTAATSAEHSTSMPTSLDIERMFAYLLAMQLRLDAADRLVELVEERRGPVPVREGGPGLLSPRPPPAGPGPRRLDEGGAGQGPLPRAGTGAGAVVRPRGWPRAREG